MKNNENSPTIAVVHISIVGTCEVPELPNGSPRGGISIGDRVDHGNGTDYKCLEGYRLNTEEIPMCNNGTWTFIPECKPGKANNLVI